MFWKGVNWWPDWQNLQKRKETSLQQTPPDICYGDCNTIFWWSQKSHKRWEWRFQRRYIRTRTDFKKRPSLRLQDPRSQEPKSYCTETSTSRKKHGPMESLAAVGRTQKLEWMQLQNPRAKFAHHQTRFEQGEKSCQENQFLHRLKQPKKKKKKTAQKSMKHSCRA